MAFLFQLQGQMLRAPPAEAERKSKEKQYQLNLLYVSMRLVDLGNTGLGQEISDHFKKSVMDADGAIRVSQRDLAALEQKIGTQNYKKEVSPFLKEIVETPKPAPGKKKTGFQ